MKINRLQFLIITILLVTTILALGYIVDLKTRNAELRRFIAVELAATRERLEELRHKIGEVDAATLRIMGELGVGELGVEERQGK